MRAAWLENLDAAVCELGDIVLDGVTYEPVADDGMYWLRYADVDLLSVDYWLKDAPRGFVQRVTLHLGETPPTVESALGAVMAGVKEFHRQLQEVVRIFEEAR